MEKINILLLLSLILSLASLSYVLRQFLTQFKKRKIRIVNLDKNNLRNLEMANKYDNYVVLFFKEDCNYSKGFKNDYRNEISFIVNRKNNAKLTSEEALIINKDFGIEIHFNKTINNLQYFFSADIDKNMKYLLSINFSKFDSSLITNIQYLFQSCISLELIDLSNLDTSKVQYMEYMFFGCYSLKSINLSNFNASSVLNMD